MPLRCNRRRRLLEPRARWKQKLSHRTRGARVGSPPRSARCRVGSLPPLLLLSSACWHARMMCSCVLSLGAVGAHVIYVLSSLMRAPLTRRPRLRWLQVEHLASKGLPLHTLAGLQRPIPKPQLSNPNPHPEPHVPEQRIGGSRERWEYRVGARKVRLYHVMCECLL